VLTSSPKHVSDEIKINEEYSKFRWVPVSEPDAFEPRRQKTLFGFRELEMDFIEAMTNALCQDPKSDIIQIVKTFQSRRDSLIRESKTEASNGVFGNNPRLLAVIAEFCNH